MPEAALKTSEKSNVLDIWRTEKPVPIPPRKLTLADKIKKKYKKINLIIGAIVAAALIFALEDYITNEIYRFLISFAAGALVSYTISTFEEQEKGSTPKSELDKELD